jgi:hypothetical protein
LSKTSPTLRRLGVGVAALTTVAAGLTAAAPFVSAATGDITNLTLAPTSAANTTGGNVCQLYTLTATEPSSATAQGGQVTVVLNPNGNMDSEFCNVSASAPAAGASGGPYVYQTTYGTTPPSGAASTTGAGYYDPNPAGNGADVAVFNLQSSATSGSNVQNTVTFGVNQSTASAAAGNVGTIFISAYPYNGATPNATTGVPAPTSGAPTGSAQEKVVAGAHQNDAVTNLAAAPTSQTGTAGQPVTYTVTATNVSNGVTSVVSGATIDYTVTDSQGNAVGTPHTDCSGDPTDQFGTVKCNVMTPTPTSTPTGTPISSGPYTVTFYAGQDAPAGCTPAASCTYPYYTNVPTATATLNSAAPAANNSQVYVTCGGSSTNRDQNNDCFEPTSASTETFTAHVTNAPPSGSAAGTEGPAESGVQVTFYFNCAGNGTTTTNQGPQAPCYNANSATAGTETATLAPASCVTGADGSCPTTLKLSGTPKDGDVWEVGARIFAGAAGATPVYSYNNPNHTNCNGSNVRCGNGAGDANVEFTNNFQPGHANNVSVSAANSTPAVGSNDVITATVKDAFGNPVNNLTPVTFTVTGVGQFSNGTTQQTVDTGPNGQAQVTLQSASTGVSHVAASISSGTTNCGSTGDTSSGAAAGNCSATADVTWTTATASPTPTPTSTGTSTPPPPGTTTTLPAFRSGSTVILGNLAGQGVKSYSLGNSTDQTVWGDWNGDGTPSLGVFRASTGTWYLTNDNQHVVYTVHFGQSGDIALVGDWNGSGTTHIGVYRPSTQTFFLSNDLNGTISSKAKYGNPGDKPIVGDWDGGHITRIGVYRPNTETFYRLNHAGIRLGNYGDRPVAGDWNGDGYTSIGVIRGTTWYLTDNNASVDHTVSGFGNPATDFTYSNGVSAAATVDS